MDSIEDVWTINSDSVTSSFRINHVAGRPLGCNKREDYIYTKTCGFGWRFAIRYDTSSPEIDVCCDFQKVAITFESITIRAYLGTLDSGEKAFRGEREVGRLFADRCLLESWKPSDVIEHERLSFIVTFTPPQNRLSIDKTRPPNPTNNALGDSICSGSFIDTRFVVFSKWLSAKTVGHPRPVFANSTTLRGRSLPLDVYLLKAPTPDSIYSEEINADDYGYESDSDLGDPDDLAGELKENESSSKEPDNSPAYFMDTFRTVVVQDAAMATWQALVYYMYTGEISFAILRSGTTQSEHVVAPKSKYQCSSKSMYRLADMLGLEDLKAAAFKFISSQITEDNVLDEIFSRFTSRYPDVLKMEMDTLRKHCTSPDVVAEVPKKTARIAAGELPHCAEILTTLFKMLG